MLKFAIVGFIFVIIFLAVYLTITYWVDKYKKQKETKKELLNESKCVCDDVKQPPTETK